MEVFCFFIGVLYVYTLNGYLIFAGFILFYLTPRYSLIVFFLLGSLIAFIHQWWETPQGMPNTPLIAHAVLQCVIVSLPLESRNKTQFIYLIKKINQQKTHALIQL